MTVTDEQGRLLSLAVLAFIGGVAVGMAAKQRERDRADLQRQIYDLRGLLAPLLAPKKGPATDDAA